MLMDSLHACTLHDFIRYVAGVKNLFLVTRKRLTAEDQPALKLRRASAEERRGI